MNNRFSRNLPALSSEDMDKLINSRVLVAGCGGLGGYVIEYLARIGTGSLTVVDGDVFTESNLNRQLLCTSGNLGVSKALAAAERVKLIDPSINVDPVCEYLTEANAPALLADADIVIGDKERIMKAKRNSKMAKDFEFDIVEHIGILAEKTKGWKREVDLISWGGAEPKIDIRDWSPDHSKMGKGITLTAEEIEKLKELI